MKIDLVLLSTLLLTLIVGCDSNDLEVVTVGVRGSDDSDGCDSNDLEVVTFGVKDGDDSDDLFFSHVQQAKGKVDRKGYSLALWAHTFLTICMN